MPNDFMATTTEAATKLYEASRDASVAIWNASVDGQERLIKLSKTWIDETAGQAKLDAAWVEGVQAQLKKGQEAGQELAQSWFAAGLASMYFPLAVIDQVVRPAAAAK